MRLNFTFQPKNAVCAATQYIKEEAKQDIKSASFSICLHQIANMDNAPDGIVLALSVLNAENRATVQYGITEILTG